MKPWKKYKDQSSRNPPGRRNAQSVSYMYDDVDRLVYKQDPAGNTTYFYYDLASHLTQVSDPLSGTYNFTYDNMGRLKQASDSYNFLSGAYPVNYGYDAASNRTSMTDPQSGLTNYVYDALNRLQTLQSPQGNFGFTYDALSRRTQMTRPNGLTTNYAYDNLSRLLSILHQVGNNTLDGATYTYENAGNRTSKLNQQSGVTENYSYDNIYQLLKVMQGSNTTEQYTYDLLGNRLSSLDAASYSYNNANEMNSNTNASYTYDKNGNTLTKVDSTGTTTYTWDYQNHLTKITLPGTGGSTTYKYDPFGRRVQKAVTVNSVTTTTNYVYDGANVLEELDTSGHLLARYSQNLGIDNPLAELRSGTTSFYEADGLGSITSLSSSAAVLVNTYTYKTFGKLSGSTGSLTNPFQYTARDFDSESGLNYYRARYYDAQIGRFLGEDPIEFYGGVNFYDYVGGNPVNYKDPSGRIPVWGWWCGPNWTGGKFEQYDPNHASQYKKPVDSTDSACMDHDICYYMCRAKYSCDEKGRGDCMRSICDAGLITTILSGPRTVMGPVVAAGIDFFNDSPDAGENAKYCPGCRRPRTGGHR